MLSLTFISKCLRSCPFPNIICFNYVLEQTLERDVPGCPVWNANIDNLADRLEQVIQDSQLRIRLGREGVLYVRRVLDFASIHRAVIDIYESI